MSLLRHDDVNWYHPLDDATEYTKDYIWSAVVNNVEFADGVITSGLKPTVVNSTGSLEGSIADGGYDKIQEGV